ncbi:MAG: TIGR01777 family oxidoreductase [Bryobacteraceae bacterium]
MMIAITGASGFIGTKLALRLRTEGYGIAPVSLRGVTDPSVLAAKVRGCGAIVHLAGEPVAQRWTAAAKQRIRDSRVLGTRLLVDAIAQMDAKPQVLVSTSAIGYYGSRGDEVLTEGSSPGSDFLAQVVRDWEAEARRAESFGVRVVLPRVGLVLGTEGGVLQKLLLPFRLGLGGRLGSGKQWSSWIHVDDLTSLFEFAILEPRITGPLNAVAPNPLTNAEFTRALAKAVHRPALFPVPEFALKLGAGEMAEMLLGGQRVLPHATEAAGFRFRHPRLADALEQLLQ